MVIIDILDRKSTRLINIYRSFTPQNNMSPRDKFKEQLELIKQAMTHETIFLGDFNIDFKKRTLPTMVVGVFLKTLMMHFPTLV